MDKIELPQEHSLLGASGMYRWQECPGSVALTKGLPNVSKYYAAEGTLAHTLSERILSYFLKNGRLPNVAKYLDETHVIDNHTIEIDLDMLEAVLLYVKHIIELYDPDNGDKLLIEHRFHLKDLHADLYGTADGVIIKPKRKKITLRDYKHGAGLLVPVKDNSQLMYYGVGALISCGYAIKEVEIGIVQPRISHEDGPIRIQTFKSKDLIEWAHDVLVPAALATEAHDAPFKTGSHCRFCLAAPIPERCTELENKVLNSARIDFIATKNTYKPQVLSNNLVLIKLMKDWIKATEEFAYAEAQQGRCPPDHKLVKKRSNRIWIDQNKAQEFLIKKGLLLDTIIEPGKFKSPAKIENLVKPALKKELTNFINKPDSGTTLVHKSDKRKAAATPTESATADFSKE